MNKASSRVLVMLGMVVVAAGLVFWLGRDTTTVVASAQPAAARCGDGVVNQQSEECDGPALAPSEPPGTRCGPDCRVLRVQTKVVAEIDDEPRCGDNRINQSYETCDGKALPEGAAPGTRCSRNCTLIAPADDDCSECVRRSCVDQRTAVDKSRSTAGAVLDCVLGKDWPRGGRAPKDTCAKNDLLTCYCENTPGQDCASTAPASLKGPCIAEIMAATDCTTSQCVAQRYMNPANANGLAMSYAQCQQDNCYDECFR